MTNYINIILLTINTMVATIRNWQRQNRLRTNNKRKQVEGELEQ